MLDSHKKNIGGLLKHILSSLEEFNFKECDIAKLEIRKIEYVFEEPIRFFINSLFSFLDIFETRAFCDGKFDKILFFDSIDSIINRFKECYKTTPFFTHSFIDLCTAYLYHWKEEIEMSCNILVNLIGKKYSYIPEIHMHSLSLLSTNYSIMDEHHKVIKLSKKLSLYKLSSHLTKQTYLNLLIAYRALGKKKIFLKYSRKLEFLLDNNSTSIENEIKYFYLMEQGSFNLQQNKNAEAIIFFRKALELFHIVKPFLGEHFMPFKLMGDAYYHKGDFISSLVYYEKAMENTNNDREKLDISLTLARTHAVLKNYTKTISYCLYAKKIAKEVNDDNKYAIYFAIGLAYIDIQDYENALNYLICCLKEQASYKKTDIPEQKLNYHIGYALMKLDKGEEAIKYFRNSFHNWPRNINSWESRSHYYIGNILECTGDFRKALREYKIAESLIGRIRNYSTETDREKIKEWLSELYHNIGRIYLKQEMYRKAAKYFKRSISISKKKQEQTLQSYEALSECYVSLGKNAKALKIHEEQRKYRNSILIQNNIKSEVDIHR